MIQWKEWTSLSNATIKKSMHNFVWGEGDSNLLSEEKYGNRVESRDKEIGLYVARSITSDILRYQLIPHS
jgi:hypothetical protein